MILFLTAFWWVCPVLGQANNIGVPFSTHYSKTNYGAGTQNWSFDNDDSGRLCVANNNGLMLFSGEHWKILPLPNRTIVRSVKVGAEQQIYVGGQGAFGYYMQEGLGNWVYTSLNEKLSQEDQNFADVWDIAIQGESVFFRATDNVFRFENGEVDVIGRYAQTTCLASVRGEIFLHDSRENGLMLYEAGEFKSLAERTLLQGVEIVEILPISKGKVLIVTSKEGMYIWDGKSMEAFTTDQPSFIRDQMLFAAARLSDSRIALGTANEGVIVLHENGKFLYRLTKGKGLQNNSVRSLFTDRANNLWVGLDNGIDFIHTRSAFTFFMPGGDVESPAYSIKIAQNTLYVGQGSGLYATPWENYYSPFSGNPFTKIPGSEGQVWGLDIVDDQLYMGHHEGAFVVEEKRIKRIKGPSGIWNFGTLRDAPDSMIAGAYIGLGLYVKKNEKWSYERQIGQLDESCRFIVQDKNQRIWVSHPYRGVYRIENPLDNSLSPRLYGATKGLPSDNFNHVFNVNDEVVVVGERGVFRFDEKADMFVPSEAYAEVFDPEERIIRLISSPSKDVWFVTDKATGLLKVTDVGIERNLEKQIFPEIQDMLVAGFEYVYPYDEHNVFFAASKGVIHLDPSRISAPDSGWKVLLEQVRVLPADTLTTTVMDIVNSFPRTVQGIRFDCAATTFEAPAKTRFRFRLKGLGEGWSAWTDQRRKEYNNLPAGRFLFEYEAINVDGVKVAGIPFRFSIAPPWYASAWALGVYALLALLGLLALILVPQRAYRKEKEYLESVHKRKEATHQRELQQTEEALAQVENEKLENEVRFKTTELASTTMHLVQKNELLITLKGELEALAKRAKTPENASDLRKLVRLLKQDIRLDDDWEQFSHHFDQVHRDFVGRLIETYPQLTPNDHRLCAYLRMNLASKEIAPLMNISVRGVEVSRYRLRKKLALPHDTNLTEFMMRF